MGTYMDEKELSSDWLIDEGTTINTNLCIYNTVKHGYSRHAYNELMITDCKLEGYNELRL